MSLINSMLQAMEYRILQRLDQNSLAATERWAKHDAELAANTKRVVDRFEKLELALEATNQSVREHHQREHEKQLVVDARIRPIRGSIAWLWLHWRDIVLLLIGLIALGTFVADAIGHGLGVNP